jgi:CheY-like chemotaxis protein
LERHGFQVLEAGDGVEATALYAENLGQIRAMVTDIMMPGMDGTVICQAVRRMDPDACILVSTGLPPGGETDSLLASLAGVGVTQVLIKPHTGEVLLRTLGEMLMGSPGLAGAIAEPAPAVA